MAYVITEPCLGTCDTSCVQVCPVDCIHGPKSIREIMSVPPPARPSTFKGIQMYIDPNACTDCDACRPVCPVTAIYDKSDVPAKWVSYIDKNEEYFKQDKPF